MAFSDDLRICRISVRYSVEIPVMVLSKKEFLISSKLVLALI